MTGMNPIALGALASLAAGSATFLGTLPLIVMRRPSENLLNVLLGGSAGVMLGATAFSLIAPAIAAGGVMPMAVGVMLGAMFVHLMDRVLPHEHFQNLGREGIDTKKLRRIWLFILAITIHNFPEGLAVGVGFGGEKIADGAILAIAIGLQNIPEGLAVAAPLLRLGYSLPYAMGVALLTGLVEPIGGLLGVSIVTVMAPLLPYFLGFAAGAMLWVVAAEIIPETHHEEQTRRAPTYGLIIGFVLMTSLDTVLEPIIKQWQW
ncbi:MAG: ZIP family metal transporter [Deltaproteobacteria bacterium]|nr:ZIP family metal transporter [Deltaproteobacteria bacterium]